MVASCRRSIPKILNSLTCLFLWCFVKTWGELERFQQPIKDDGSLSFLVVGDWGRKGLYNQSDVAFQMGRVGEKLSIDFIVSTGDNFYENGLSSTNDPAFQLSFTKVYTANFLQKQWYIVLGNHDYRGNVKAQLSPVLRNLDSRWLCRRSFVVDADIAELFFVDTTPFVDKYFLKPKKYHFDWRGVLPRNQYLSNLLNDLQSALQESTANWKIVVGHHTIKSIGLHRETKELLVHLLPVLEANDVDMYINGHDHCLEHMSSVRSSIQFPTSGGGSKAWRGVIYPDMKDEVKFYYDGQGFTSIDLTQTDATIAFYDTRGKVLHKFNLFKRLIGKM